VTLCSMKCNVMCSTRICIYAKLFTVWYSPLLKAIYCVIQWILYAIYCLIQSLIYAVYCIKQLLIYAVYCMIQSMMLYARALLCAFNALGLVHESNDQWKSLKNDNYKLPCNAKVIRKDCMILMLSLVILCRRTPLQDEHPLMAVALQCMQERMPLSLTINPLLYGKGLLKPLVRIHIISGTLPLTLITFWMSRTHSF